MLIIRKIVALFPPKFAPFLAFQALSRLEKPTAQNGVTWVYDDRNKALIPDAVKAKVDSLQALIVAGTLHVPTEP